MDVDVESVADSEGTGVSGSISPADLDLDLLAVLCVMWYISTQTLAVWRFAYNATLLDPARPSQGPGSASALDTYTKDCDSPEMRDRKVRGSLRNPKDDLIGPGPTRRDGGSGADRRAKQRVSGRASSVPVTVSKKGRERAEETRSPRPRVEA
ncbi:hypothetical protein B0H10DRAFT_2190933 [Mycena sp. CBHHK59/15]|nr:hypothetical protein B0H10DRAFT_2190933 [Mycena sp. CBHHK59/15]